MTYQEIQDRLSKCEKTLKDLKAGNYSNLSTKKTKLQVEKLTILRESLQRQLKEANGKLILKQNKIIEISEAISCVSQIKNYAN